MSDSWEVEMKMQRKGVEEDGLENLKWMDLCKDLCRVLNTVILD